MAVLVNSLKSENLYKDLPEIVIGEVATAIGMIKKVSTVLTAKDKFGAWKARWNFNRMHYTVKPGLYCVGNPDGKAPVLVTSNYKLTFDSLRKELSGINAWIMVLDTEGINVWCAAAKGTFGTDEIVTRLAAVRLSEVVSHRTLILPQLGAPGVSAHEVLKRTGFKVVYGTVRASDVPEFIRSGMNATKAMREVKFTFSDRLALVPLEVIVLVIPALIILAVLYLLRTLGVISFSALDTLPYFGAALIGTAIVPLLLPWIPGRAFALKGWLLGFLEVIILVLINLWVSYNQSGFNWQQALSYLLILPSISAYLAMNFTGAATYPSQSGVLKEMSIAFPLIAISFVSGLIFMIVRLILKF